MDSKFQKMGETIDNAFGVFYAWLAVLFVLAVIITAAVIRHKRVVREKGSSSRIGIIILVGLFVLVLAPLVIGTFL